MLPKVSHILLAEFCVHLSQRWASEGVKHDTDVHDGGAPAFLSPSASEVV